MLQVRRPVAVVRDAQQARAHQQLVGLEAEDAVGEPAALPNRPGVVVVLLRAFATPFALFLAGTALLSPPLLLLLLLLFPRLVVDIVCAVVVVVIC